MLLRCGFVPGEPCAITVRRPTDRRDLGLIECLLDSAIERFGMNKKRFGTGSTGDHAEQDTDVDVPIDDILEQSRSLFEAMEEDEKRIRSGEQPISPDHSPMTKCCSGSPRLRPRRM